MDNDVFHIDETGFTGDFGGETAIPTSYEDLTNKPSINGVELSGDKTTEDLGINIPVSLADLQDDAEHRTVTDEEKTAWNGKADPSAIPAKVSDLTNDAGYQNADEVRNAVNSLNADYTEKESYPFAITVFDVAEGGNTTINLVQKNPTESGDSDKIRLRWITTCDEYNPNRIDIGAISWNNQTAFRTIEGKAINSSGAIVDDASSQIFIFPISKSHLYNVTQTGTITNAWLSTSNAYASEFKNMSQVALDSEFDSATKRTLLLTVSMFTAVMIHDITADPNFISWEQSIPTIDTIFRWHIPGDGVIQPQKVRNYNLNITNGVPKLINKNNSTSESTLYVVDLKDVTWSEKTDGLIDGYFTFPVNANYSSSNDLTRKTSASAVASTNNSYWIDSTGEHKHIRIHIDDYASYTLEQTIAALATAGMEIAVAHYAPDTVEVTYTQEGTTEPIPVTCKNGANYYAGIGALSVTYQKDSKKVFKNCFGIPDAPTANGTYVLKCTKTTTGVTYAWVKDT